MKQNNIIIEMNRKKSVNNRIYPCISSYMAIMMDPNIELFVSDPKTEFISTDVANLQNMGISTKD